HFLPFADKYVTESARRRQAGESVRGRDHVRHRTSACENLRARSARIDAVRGEVVLRLRYSPTGGDQRAADVCDAVLVTGVPQRDGASGGGERDEIVVDSTADQ